MASLALKYRPNNFEDLAGQLHASQSLKNAIEFDRVSHAYLFFGSRGVGKTSTARIFAKCLNCQTNGVSTHPCGECENCVEIAQGRNIDVIEMDAASNRGIDHIRDLRENVRFSPMKSKHKIYIIDEVHMLTTESFNALLKTLEEPPPHAVFIMATTEYHKIPETILSRCQSFAFKKFNENEIVQRLETILTKEAIEFEPQALTPIARKGEGSMRDAISLLDQALSYCAGTKLNEKTVIEILGIIPGDLYASFLENLRTRNLKSSLELLEKLHTDGYNLKNFLRDFLEFIKNCTLIKSGVLEKTDSLFLT
ncbi:MAG: DNA polymerase III subunit gamma/tau, partial [Leptospirales bacterium]